MWDFAAQNYERCAECGFDASDYTDHDVAGAFDAVMRRCDRALHGVDELRANTRPAPASWSPNELVRHMKSVVVAMRFLVDLALSATAEPLHGAPPDDATSGDEVPVLDTARELRRLTEEAAALMARWSDLDAQQISAAITLNDQRADVGGIVRHCLHELHHHSGDLEGAVAAVMESTAP